jgi:hypothetical protein
MISAPPMNTSAPGLQSNHFQSNHLPQKSNFPNFNFFIRAVYDAADIFAQYLTMTTTSSRPHLRMLNFRSLFQMRTSLSRANNSIKPLLQ